MLGEKLKNRMLFHDEEAVAARGCILAKAVDILEECVDHLVLAMRTIESLDILSRDEVEEYVIAYLQAYEGRYYSMNKDEYDEWLISYLKRR